MRQGWLIFADSGWLRKLRTGIDISLWMMLGSVVVSFLLGLLLVMSVSNNGQGVNPVDFQIFTAVSSIIFLIAWLIVVWYLTTPERVRYGTAMPGQGITSPGAGLSEMPPLKEQRTTLCRWCLFLNVLPILSLPMYGFGFSLARSLEHNKKIFGALLVLIGLIGLVGSCVGYFLLLIHLRRIARRDTRKGLGKFFSFLIWSAVITVGWTVVGTIILVMVSRFAPAMMMIPTTAPANSSIGYVALNTGNADQTATDEDVSSQQEKISDESEDESIDYSATPDGVAANSTAPSPTSRPAALGLPPRLGPFLIFFFATVGCSELFCLAWVICYIVTTFMFRGMLTRSIEQNMSHVWRGMVTTPPAIGS